MSEQTEPAAPAPDGAIPEAATPDAMPLNRPILIGPPFAMSDYCELIERQCFATVECDCGQPFRVDLLAAGAKACPGCDTEFTHVLVITQARDTEMAQDMVAQILHSNGLTMADDGQDDDDGEGDDDDDGQDDDGEGDDDDGQDDGR